MRANTPFFFARAIVRGKFNSTTWPACSGVVTGSRTRTPVLLMLLDLPLKKRFASGNQTLTGQDTSVLALLRCSTNVSIPLFSKSVPDNYRTRFSNIFLIGSVNLGRLDELGKMRNFPKILSQNPYFTFFVRFYRAKSVKNFIFSNKFHNNTADENLLCLNLISRYLIGTDKAAFNIVMGGFSEVVSVKTI